MKIFILFMMLLSIMSCSTDSQNEDDVNYLSSYSNNEDGNIDENNDNQNQNTDNRAPYGKFSLIQNYMDVTWYY